MLEVVSILGHANASLELLEILHRLGIGLNLAILLDGLPLVVDALDRNVVAIQVADLLDVQLLSLRAVGIHVGELSDQTRAVLRLRLLVLLL